MDERLRVGIYLRISEDRDGQQTATSRQLADCQAYCERRGWEVEEVFEDVDLSAYSTRVKRPHFARMLEALRSGDIAGVVVWKLDRLTRQQRDLSRVMEACEPHKAFIASVTEPIDTRETYGQFVAELLVAQARMESANTSARVARKAVEQREQGLPPSNGRRCFGYEQDYSVIREDEAALLRDARDRLFAGETLNGIAWDWERRDIRSTLGHPWRAHILKRLLASATLSAQRDHGGRLYAGQWPTIFSPEDTTRLRALFAARHRANAISTTARKSLLTSFVRCGRCGGRMQSSRRADEKRRYVCARSPGATHCGSMSILADDLEDFVFEMLVAAIDDAALGEALRQRGDVDDGLAGAVRKDEEALEALSIDFYAEHVIGREEYLAARGAINQRLEANRVRLGRRQGKGMVEAFLGSSGALREAWVTRSLDWRRSLLGALIDHVAIQPASRKGRQPFEPARVVPVWRY